MAHQHKTYPNPYRSRLQERIEPGQTLTVKGRAFSSADTFTINFVRGPDFEEGDKIFHISVRYSQKKIILNTREHGKWGKEESHKNHLKQGDKFDIRIRAHDKHFQVFINNEEFCKYEHRAPISGIDHFSVEGDCELQHIHWGGRYYSVPFESGITGGLDPGRKITIYGIVEKKPTEFKLNLKKSNGDVAYHFDPRWKEKAVVRNSSINGAWGNEERQGGFPFEKNHIFDIEIINEQYSIQTIVNGEHYCAYAHRTDPHGITGLSIEGDVELIGIVVD